jgi:hypothetical protein
MLLGRNPVTRGRGLRMKTYTCICGQLFFFENVACVNCRRELGFLPDLLWLTSLDPESDGLWRPTAEQARSRLYKKCQNYTEAKVCNWMIPQEVEEAFCASCRLNEIIPDLTSEENRNLWASTETAKRRLVYSLIRLKLPIANKKDDPQQGLAFRFLADAANPDGSTAKVMTGHDQGIITLNIAEANDSAREKIRHAMNEPYRALLGHFRHEIGHYYWDRLVRDTKFLEPYRTLFGDESADYDQALKQYYKSGAPANWQEDHISAYATAHPWEDWAETWAHFLHIQDALEVANDFGLVGKRILLSPQEKKVKSWLSSKQKSFEEVIGSWSELAVALNSINRSMGLNDLYPFVLSPAVVAKLRFIYEVIVVGSAAPARPIPSVTKVAS